MTRSRQHPSAWRPDVERLRHRLAAELRSRDSPWPEVGAAALVARGLAGETRQAWAATLGIDEDALARLEAGELEPGTEVAQSAAPFLRVGRRSGPP